MQYYYTREHKKSVSLNTNSQFLWLHRTFLSHLAHKTSHSDHIINKRTITTHKNDQSNSINSLKWHLLSQIRSHYARRQCAMTKVQTTILMLSALQSWLSCRLQSMTLHQSQILSTHVPRAHASLQNTKQKDTFTGSNRSR